MGQPSGESPKRRSEPPRQAEGRPRDGRWVDDDDWVGEPPEGPYSRDRAKPDFWRAQRPPEIIAAAFVLAVIVLVVVLVLK